MCKWALFQGISSVTEGNREPKEGEIRIRLVVCGWQGATPRPRAHEPEREKTFGCLPVSLVASAYSARSKTV